MIQTLVSAGAVALLVGSVAFTAHRLAPWFAGTRDPLAALLVRAVLAIVLVVLVMQILGAAALLYPVPVAGAQVAIALLTWRLTPQAPPPRVRLDRPALAFTVLLAAALVLAVVASLNGRSLEADTSRYHIVNAAQWLNAHQLWTLPYSQPGDHTAADPGNGELISLWLMLPSHSDALAYVPNVLFAAVAILAVALLAQRLGGPPLTAAWLVVGLLTTIEILPTQLHSMLPDLGAAAMVVAGLALAVGDTAPRGRTLLLAGACCGYALGARYTAVPGALVVMALVLTAVGRGHRWTGLGVIAAGAAAVGAFWYVRNLAETGNPIYPQAVSLAGRTILAGTHGPLTFQPTSMLGQVEEGHLQVVMSFADAALVILGPAVIVVLVGMLPARTALRAWRRRILAVTLALLAGHLVLPFSGGGATGSVPDLAVSFRYLDDVFLVALAVASTRLSWRVALVLGGSTLAYNAVQLARLPGRPDLSLSPAVIAVTAAVCVAVALALLAWRRVGTRARPAILAACALGGAVAAVGAAGGLLPAESPALEESIHGDRAVAVINVADMRSVLGPDLTTPVVAVGRPGPGSEEQEITDPAAFSAALAQLHPAVVIVGTDTSDTPLPPWSPPASWRRLGPVGDATTGGIAYATGW